MCTVELMSERIGVGAPAKVPKGGRREGSGLALIGVRRLYLKSRGASRGWIHCSITDASSEEASRAAEYY